jgi:uncharacterized protein (DUF4415 family)
MKKEYDFSESTRNPYIKKLKKQVTILEEEVVEYFRQLSEETGMVYQTLINLYLQDCVKAKRKPSMEWINSA